MQANLHINLKSKLTNAHASNLKYFDGGYCIIRGIIPLGSCSLLNTDSMDSLAADIADVNVSFVASPLVKKKQGPEQMSLW